MPKKHVQFWKYRDVAKDISRCGNFLRNATGLSVHSSLGSTDEVPSLEEEILRKPWKFIGYEGYAAFLASDDDFFILRRFDRLNCRIGLARQDEIVRLEDDLSRLDKAYSKREAQDVNNGTLRDDLEDRQKLVDLIDKALYRYNEFLLQQSSLRKLPKAPLRDIKSIRNWHYNHDYAAIARDEQQYLDHDDDLICMVQRDKTPMRRLIDKSRRMRTLSIWEHKNERKSEHDTDEVSFYSDKRIDNFASAVIVTIGVTMLITPIWVLQAMDSLQGKLGVITAFILIFLLVLSFAMVAKPFEALGATAAYAAVLMVFIQLGT
ncbi:hypothetical protein FZEAL_2764 [Fusarium zealandicum]|uniref:DUF6594 domain-containing protein n=1 Tax=Fusarium zealandicum TaxID=1053134 RepID=A0A8H4UQV8_9HYPO|nr:hypothetical protein FZEAL_2764 [Fusarium zealandicum]